MHLGFCFPPLVTGERPLDFTRLFSDPRGMSGTDLHIVTMPYEMAKRGHEVTLYTQKPNADSYAMGWRSTSVKLADLDEFLANDAGRSLDAFCVTCDMGVLRLISDSCMRVCFQMLNGFDYGKACFDDFVDLYLSPSQGHLESNWEWPTERRKWKVLPLGCYPEDYPPESPKTSGLCIWTSSHGRGLHLLLEQWPAIVAAVPHAQLRIFYHGLKEWLEDWRKRRAMKPPKNGWDAITLEEMRRTASIDRSLQALEGKSVYYGGSLSRIDLQRELRAASVMPYSCSTMVFTEGFSISVLEGCASGALPVISSCDALGGIYGAAVPMVESPIEKRIDEWRALVVQALTEEAWANEWRAKARRFAEAHAWPLLAESLERLLVEQQ